MTPLRRPRRLPPVFRRCSPASTGSAPGPSPPATTSCTSSASSTSQSRSVWVGRHQGLRDVVRQVLLQVYFTGAQGIVPVAALALVVGALAIAEGLAALGPLSGAEGLGRLVTVVVLREIAPLLTGMIVIVRSVTAIAAELGVMRVQRETEALEAMGVSPILHLVTPRLLGGVLALAGLNVVFDVVSPDRRHPGRPAARAGPHRAVPPGRPVGLRPGGPAGAGRQGRGRRDRHLPHRLLPRDGRRQRPDRGAGGGVPRRAARRRVPGHAARRGLPARARSPAVRPRLLGASCDPGRAGSPGAAARRADCTFGAGDERWRLAPLALAAGEWVALRPAVVPAAADAGAAARPGPGHGRAGPGQARSRSWAGIPRRSPTSTCSGSAPDSGTSRARAACSRTARSARTSPCRCRSTPGSTGTARRSWSARRSSASTSKPWPGAGPTRWTPPPSGAPGSPARWCCRRRWSCSRAPGNWEYDRGRGVGWTRLLATRQETAAAAALCLSRPEPEFEAWFEANGGRVVRFEAASRPAATGERRGEP